MPARGPRGDPANRPLTVFRPAAIQVGDPGGGSSCPRAPHAHSAWSFSPWASCWPPTLNALTAVLVQLATEPATGPLYADKAEALLEVGRADQAASAARQALSLNGRLLKPHWILAVAAERRGAWAEAREHLHAILRRLEPDHPEAPAIRARLNAAERALGRGVRR